MAKKAAREIVVPGDLLDDAGTYKPGPNTYRDGGRIYASRLGVKTVRGDVIGVIGLSGRYEPYRGDMVIGTVVETGPSNWYLKIGASHDVGMHVNDVPWRVEFGETSKYLDVGDTVFLKIFHVDELKRVQVSMKDRQCRKLTGGVLIEVAPTKVPRIIGRGGSMISVIKNLTNTRMFVGQNGVVWVDGEPKDVELAIAALRRVEAEAHTTGLTDKITKWLEEQVPERAAALRENARPAREGDETDAPASNDGDTIAAEEPLTDEDEEAGDEDDDADLDNDKES
ncbi:MAG TPA: exosome complex RNA-binding protein Rrp4 [Candidatus Thermoplasmatota archaeon]|nr:exosome complex RNA-binding protein Rrp4 [Candidatus Thermoplasmatota archaeon]